MPCGDPKPSVTVERCMHVLPTAVLGLSGMPRAVQAWGRLPNSFTVMATLTTMYFPLVQQPPISCSALFRAPLWPEPLCIFLGAFSSLVISKTTNCHSYEKKSAVHDSSRETDFVLAQGVVMVTGCFEDLARWRYTTPPPLAIVMSPAGCT